MKSVRILVHVNSSVNFNHLVLINKKRNIPFNTLTTLKKLSRQIQNQNLFFKYNKGFLKKLRNLNRNKSVNRNQLLNIYFYNWKFIRDFGKYF